MVRMLDPPSAEDVHAGQRVYTRRVLSAYDVLVLGFSCRFVWRCPKALMLANYDRNVGARHVEFGVGTGYLLDHCRMGVQPSVTLVDLNSDALDTAAARIFRYRPAKVRADVLGPVPLGDASADSLALNFLLHCVPGGWEQKGEVFANAARIVRPGGRVFGSTILAAGVPRRWPAPALMRLYNRKGIFHNLADDLAGLTGQLQERFDDVTVSVHGCVAVFEATARFTRV
jgi:ubiquinone/menaquinone biosynthesis C-methylase UbiE